MELLAHTTNNPELVKAITSKKQKFVAEEKRVLVTVPEPIPSISLPLPAATVPQPYPGEGEHLPCGERSTNLLNRLPSMAHGHHVSAHNPIIQHVPIG